MSDSIASILRDDNSWREYAKTKHAYSARLLFAEFIKRVSDDVNTSAWYFSVRGNCRLSLNRVLGLSPRSYAALLFAADFVQLRRKDVRVNKANMEENWLKHAQYGLGGNSNGCAEMTNSGVFLSNLNPSYDVDEEKMTRLDLFRIGRYQVEGETIKASAAINDGVDPPPLSHRLRTHQRWLSLNLRYVIAPFLEKKHRDNLARVEEWVRCPGLDDSLVLHYNLATKQQTVSTTLPTDAANGRTNNEEEDAGLWDAAFAIIHKQDPTEVDCKRAQVCIDKAMELHRKLNFNVTPKTHGMEKHVVAQMRKFAGGLAKLIEHWVEHYHQIGHGYDMKWINQPSEHKKAIIRSNREFAFSHPEVVKRRERIFTNIKKRKAPEAVVAAAEERKRAKTERRDGYVNRALEQQASEGNGTVEGVGAAALT